MPRVICTAIFSNTFLIDSTDCRVSALRSFIFQDGCSITQNAQQFAHLSTFTHKQLKICARLPFVQTAGTKVAPIDLRPV